MDFNDWTKPEEKTSQGYGNDYYQNPQQGYGNGYYQNPQQGYGNGYYHNQQQGYGNDYYRNPQQQQYYNNTGYQDPMMDDRFSQPDFNNSGYSREKLYAEKRRKAQERGKTFNIKGAPAILLLIWILGSMFGSLGITAITGHAGWFLILFGQLIAVLGIAAFVQEKRKFDNLITLIFPFIGIPMFVIGLVSVFGSEMLKQQLMNLVPFLFLSVFLFVGLTITVIMPISAKKKKERCTDSVTAVVVDLISSRGRRSTVYHAVYEYYYKGQVYWERDSYGSNVGVPHIGKEVEIFVNPDDPTDYFVVDKGRNIVPLIIGIAFIALPIFTLVTMFSQ